MIDLSQLLAPSNTYNCRPPTDPLTQRFVFKFTHLYRWGQVHLATWLFTSSSIFSVSETGLLRSLSGRKEAINSL